MIKIISLTTLLLLTLHTVFAAESGMPQLDPTYWASQVFWLTIIFSGIYFLIAKIFVPKTNIRKIKSLIFMKLILTLLGFRCHVSCLALKLLHKLSSLEQ